MIVPSRRWVVRQLGTGLCFRFVLVVRLFRSHTLQGSAPGILALSLLAIGVMLIVCVSQLFGFASLLAFVLHLLGLVCLSPFLFVTKHP